MPEAEQALREVLSCETQVGRVRDGALRLALREILARLVSLARGPAALLPLPPGLPRINIG